MSKIPELPFLIKTVITAVTRNAAGIEEKKFIPATFQLDEKGASMPWYALRNFIVPAYLNRTLGPQGSGWIKIYEIKIQKMINRHSPNDIESIPVRVMTMDQLQAYCTKWEMPVKPNDYHSVEYARQMVTLCETDPTGFQKQHEAYLEGLNRKYPEMDGLRKNTEVAFTKDLDAEFDALEGQSKKSAPDLSAMSQADVAAMSVVDEQPTPDPVPVPEKPVKVAKVKKTSVPAPAGAPDPFAGV